MIMDPMIQGQRIKSEGETPKWMLRWEPWLLGNPDGVKDVLSTRKDQNSEFRVGR